MENVNTTSDRIPPSIIRIVPGSYNKFPSQGKKAKVILVDNPSSSKLRKTASGDPVTSQIVRKESLNRTISEFSGLNSHSDSLLLKSEISSQVHSEQCCCSCRETLQTILQQHQEILKYLKKNKYPTGETKLDLLPPMPFNDRNDFLDFDESLTHDNVREQFLFKLKKLLVSTEQKSVSNIMSSIITDELCKTISWIGIKDTVPFGTTNMVTMIVDLVQEHHLLDIDVIQSRIAEWLRRCGDRINNEIKRRKRRKE